MSRDLGPRQPGLGPAPGRRAGRGPVAKHRYTGQTHPCAGQPQAHPTRPEGLENAPPVRVPAKDRGLDQDGVCDELEVPGCTNVNAVNFDVSATDDDGSCIVPLSPGCTYPSASNYEADADYDDGSCTFDGSGSNDCPNDIDGDGTVAVSDLLLLLSSYGYECE